jgi:hypothetical protein
MTISTWHAQRVPCTIWAYRDLFEKVLESPNFELACSEASSQHPVISTIHDGNYEMIPRRVFTMTLSFENDHDGRMATASRPSCHLDEPQP